MKLHERLAAIMASRLDMSARAILFVLATYLDSDDEERAAWPSTETIGQQAGCSRQTVGAILARLESLGVVVSGEVRWPAVLALAPRPLPDSKWGGSDVDDVEPYAGPLTHAALCTLGYRWLLSARGRCIIAVVEPYAGGACCIPDAIGWTRFGHTITVEAKVSRGDYRADTGKTSHVADRIPGHMRWYITPAGLVAPGALRPGWGLLEVGKTGRVRVAHDAPAVEPTNGGLVEAAAIHAAVSRRLRDGGSIDPETGRLSTWREVAP